MPSKNGVTGDEDKGARAGGRVLVTGASAGIGLELAKEFAARRHELVLLARSADKLAALARELTAVHGVKVRILPADLSDPGVPQAVFDELRGRQIDIDILVNDAGVEFEGPFADIGLEDHLRLVQINIVALTALTHLFLRPMLDRRRGRILNVASIAAFMPVPQLAAYAAAKSYVLSLTESLSEELRGSGVTATALCPGFTDTAMLRESPRGQSIPSMMVMSAEAIAAEGYAACLAGRTICVPGTVNSAMTSGAQLLPRGIVRTVGGLITRRQAPRKP